MVIDATVPAWMYFFLIWTVVWTAVASWKAARKGHLIWFTSFFFFFFNTFGVLPIIYILFFQNFSFSVKVGGSTKKKAVKKKKAKKFPKL